MHIKRYEAANMREAMSRIKKELGPDAVILSTKKMQTDGSQIEVVAARERDSASPETVQPVHPQAALPRIADLCDLRREIGDLKSYIDTLSQKLMFKTEFHELKETLNMLCDTVSNRHDLHLQHLYLLLIANGFSRIRALRLTESVRKECSGRTLDTPEKISDAAEKVLARTFRQDSDSGRRIRAFVGPTGVGKTTTLAKLAAHYCLEENKKVGLITTDTYRIGAPEQLKIYAKIMGLPLDIASDRDTFVRSMERFADKDLVLVDTPGRSRQDNRCLALLKSLLAEDAETFLLLSPSTNREYLMEVADRYRVLQYDHIILTKIDECASMGQIVDVLDNIGKPVSHLTTGQNVPKDIERADPKILARLTLQNRLH